MKTIKEFLTAHPDHEVQVCLNIQGQPEGDMRYSFLLLKRPYRPQTIGVYVAPNDEDAIKQFLTRPIAQPRDPIKDNGGARS